MLFLFSFNVLIYYYIFVVVGRYSILFSPIYCRVWFKQIEVKLPLFTSFRSNNNNNNIYYYYKSTLLFPFIP